MRANDSTRIWVDKAYKKLKGSVYFDKTQLPLLHELVCFEERGISDALNRLADLLEGGDAESWEDYETDITAKIDALVYPKKLCTWDENQVIFNMDNEPIEMKKAQYFINMPVEGHILGTLWVLTVGALLDNRKDSETLPMYEHSYGNRLRKNLYHEDSKEITYSPYLFEPYFSQYENWRDQALVYAKERLDDKQDALILTLDLRSFFYSVHIPKNSFDIILKSKDEEMMPSWVTRVHTFVYHVLESYSNKVRSINKDPELALGNRTFLPIGFLPSNILSNWVLTPFDEAICLRFNPVYYGRYVDDIIIVDKVEKNSPLRKKAQGNNTDHSKLTVQDVISHYFCSCLSTKESDGYCKNTLFLPIHIEEMTPSQKKAYKTAQNQEDKGINPFLVYRINSDVLPGNDFDGIHSDIQIQNDKVKVFYFREGATRALLDCFRTQIGQNASEFRSLPDMESTLDNNDYSEIFKLQNDETLHKLRGVSAVSLDRFSFSKFLGKYRKASGMIRDKKENAFERDLLSILSKRILIENYTLWERLLEIMIVNDRLENYESLAKKIIKAIETYRLPGHTLVSTVQYQHTAFLLTLRTAICRTSALCWGKKMATVLTNIQEAVQRSFPKETNLFFEKELVEMRADYCRSRMVNKYVLPLPIGWLDYSAVTDSSEKSVNLCHLESFIKNVDWNANSEDYTYFPYMVTPQEIAYALACKNIADGTIIMAADQQWKLVKKYYMRWNFGIANSDDNKDGFGEIRTEPMPNISHSLDKSCCAVSISSPPNKKLRVSIGNARLYEQDFKHALTGKPNRTFERYQQISQLLKDAIHEKVDLLVLPESYLPWEWLPDVLRLCANNQIALITGIEHIVSPKRVDGSQKVYNLTAVILPYRKDDYKFAHVVYHQKVHFSPEEFRQIKGYRLEPFEGKEYQLFQWRDLWFSVYCCYELASIAERSLFQSFTDLTIAVEWNKDVPYFSSIVESLCRDLHCYCIQANSSDFGDSRVMSPSKTALRDIIKTKGGANYTILVDEIDIDALREYQRKESELQRDDESYKPTPPNFQPGIAEHKQNGTLWDYIKKTQSLFP